MDGQGFFFQAFVYLLAAVVSVPLARRLGFGSVLGYLVAGAVIGPHVLGLVGAEGQDVLHFAEFGVVMMLFLVGLELQPRLLWRMRGPLLGFGGLQVAGTAAVVAGIAGALGLGWPSAVAVGLVLALSSTAIVLQSLGEKGLLKSEAGQISFSVLLFQDLAVIPMLAVMPLLASAGGGTPASSGEAHWTDALPAWAYALVVLAAVAGIVAGGRWLVRPVFRYIARARLREIFTAAALLLVIGIALLMQLVDMSPALGTFLAGVVLADSEFRKELEGDVEPFKGLLLGVFFIAVGASVDLGLVAAEPVRIGALVIGLLAVKVGVLLAVGRGLGLGAAPASLVALALAQGGEFAFVLLSFAAGVGLVDLDVSAALVAVVAVSMALTPFLLLLHERILAPRLGRAAAGPARPHDAIEGDAPVIIAGFGRFGSVVGRLLRASGVGATVLDNDPDHVDLLRRLGLPVFYGDACRPDLLRAAGAERARVIVLAIDDHEKVLELVQTVRAQFPHLAILARATGRAEAYALVEAGVEHVYRETLDTSLRAGVDAMRLLGERAHQAVRAARSFRRHDEASVRDLAGVRGDQAAYVLLARQRIADLERILVDERDASLSTDDAAWDTESLREEILRMQASG